MKAVILAAGMGTRLKSDVPKSLCKVKENKTILDFQIEKLSKLVGIDNILIVVGYKKEKIMNKFSNLMFVFNKAYSTTNTSKSSILALQKINDDVLCIDGDVFFDEKILSILLKSRYSSYVVTKKKCTNQETRYKLNEKGFIKQISKNLSVHDGESLGVRLIKKSDLDKFRKELQKVEVHVFQDEAMGHLTDKNTIKLKPTYARNLFCKGINTPKDLEIVKNYLSNK